MTEQEVLENAFHKRDLATLRSFKQNYNVDFSFNNNAMLDAIILEDLHPNYINLLQSRDECNINLLLPELSILSAKMRKKQFYESFNKKLDYLELTLDLNFNYFLELVKVADIEYICKTVDRFFYLIEDNIIPIYTLLNYLKEGIVFLINHYNHHLLPYQIKKYLGHSTSNFIFIRTILNINNTNTDGRRIEYLTAISFLCQDIIIENENEIIMDFNFIKKISHNDSDLKLLTYFTRNSHRAFLRNPIPHDIYTLYSSRYKAFAIKIFKLSHIDNPTYNIQPSQFLRLMFNDNNNLSKNALSIEFIKKQKNIDFNNIHSAIYAKNQIIFDFLFVHYNLKNIEINHNLIVFIFSLNPLKYTHFIDKIASLYIHKNKRIPTINIINMLSVSETIFIYLLKKYPAIFKLQIEKTDVIEIYEYVFLNNLPNVVKYLIINQFCFEIIDLNLLLKIKGITEENKKILTRAYNLHHF